jgi:hypothetical protein
MIVIIVGLSKPFACFFLCFALSLLSYTSKNEVSGFQLSAEIALTHRRKPTIRHAIRRRLQFFTDQSHVLPSFSDSLQRRLLADPSFIKKSVVEVSLAALTQLLAEIGKRGRDRILPEIDFVLAGLLTAVAGKYYSMWKVAPTASTNSSDSATTSEKNKERNLPVIASPVDSWWEKVPTNAFQGTCIDGSHPSVPLRLASFIKPIPSLFCAGYISSLFGYGITAAFIALRSLLLPYHVSQTQSVNILSACLFTGTFMAVVSNVRYQLLSGIIEPKIIDPFFKDRHHPSLHGSIILLVRLANGYVGSFLAIAGMRWLGLQRLK